MDWDDLRVFLAVVRAETLSGAGRVLRCDPATVGRRIARLETARGARLFHKSPQGYGLTEAGARLLPLAEKAEAALAEVEGAGPLAPHQGLHGPIRLGAPDGCANYLLPQVLAALCAENPGLEVQLVSLPRVLNLSRREADLLISVSRPEAGRLNVQKIADYHLHLAASRAYLAEAGTPQSRADLPGRPIIGYIPDMIFDKELDYQAELGLPPVRLASNSVSVQLQYLRQGAGIGIVHDFALPAAPELAFVLPNTVRLTRAFYLVRPEGAGQGASLSRFAEALTQGLRREIAAREALAQKMAA